MESGIDLCGSVSERPFLIRVSSLWFSADLDRFLMEIEGEEIGGFDNFQLIGSMIRAFGWARTG